MVISRHRRDVKKITDRREHLRRDEDDDGDDLDPNQDNPAQENAQDQPRIPDNDNDQRTRAGRAVRRPQHLNDFEE